MGWIPDRSTDNVTGYSMHRKTSRSFPLAFKKSMLANTEYKGRNQTDILKLGHTCLYVHQNTSTLHRRTVKNVPCLSILSIISLLSFQMVHMLPTASGTYPKKVEAKADLNCKSRTIH